MSRRVLIMGAAGRDFHNFNVVYRDDPQTEVVAFTATQIPFIDDRTYPASLAGGRYPNGIPIHDETELRQLIADLEVETVEWCREMLTKSPLALRMLKASMNAADDGLAGIQQLAGDATLLYYMTEEAQEGKQAYLEKRKPAFDKYPKRP